MTTLKRIKFGHIAAEEEAANLQEYFLETPEYQSIINDTNKILVVGRKGSGKSAIDVALKNRYLKQSEAQVEAITFKDYPWALHNKIKDESGSAERAYLNTWKYLILITLGKHLVRFNEPQKYRIIDSLWWKKLLNANLRLLDRFLRLNYGSIAPSFADVLIDRARNIRKLNVSAFSTEAPQDNDDFLKLVKSINIVCKELETVVLSLLPRRRPEFFVLFDELDLGWDDSEDFKHSIIGLILAARDLVRSARAKSISLHIVIFLRSDIYEALRFQDKNKISPDVVALVWDDNKLKELVDARLKATGNASWDDAFTNDHMRHRVTKFKYIVRRTMLRPRDMIQYCLMVHEEALKAEGASITNDHIYAVEPRYSVYMRNELRDENFV